MVKYGWKNQEKNLYILTIISLVGCLLSLTRTNILILKPVTFQLLLNCINITIQQEDTFLPKNSCINFTKENIFKEKQASYSKKYTFLTSEQENNIMVVDYSFISQKGKHFPYLVGRKKDVFQTKSLMCIRTGSVHCLIRNLKIYWQIFTNTWNLTNDFVLF